MSKSMFNAPHFQTVEAAREYLEALRWGTERVCPHCGTLNKSFATKKPGVYRCQPKECRKDFSVTTKSVMESSHIKLNVWLQAFFLMASSKKGVSSHQLHRALGITYKSAWFLTHRIREAMRSGGLLPPMGSGGGTVEADDLFRTARRTAQEGAPWHVQQKHREIGREFVSHDSVNHSRDEYVRGSVHTNTVEGYYSIFKRGMKGVYQHCAEKHLHRYLSEFDFRYSNRVALGVNDGERADLAIKGAAGKRLTYRQPH
jgi:transposase-like protein